MIDRKETRGFHPFSGVRSLAARMQGDLEKSRTAFEEGLAGNRDGKEPKHVRKPSLYSDNYPLDLQPPADPRELINPRIQLRDEHPHALHRPIYW